MQAKLKTPLLWVAGTSDPSQKDGPDFAFAKAPPNDFNRYVKVAADHLGTPDASREPVLAWLKDLQKIAIDRVGTLNASPRQIGSGLAEIPVSQPAEPLV